MRNGAPLPDDARDLTRVATYTRALPVGIARVWENVLDWEHLPWLHRTSFLDIDAIEADRGGWRARVGLPPAERRQEIEIEVRLERDARRYVTRTLVGPGEGTEIWTSLTERSPAATDIEVCFHVPGIEPDQADAVGGVFVALYRRLWDEDEAMMVRRAELLARPRAAVRETCELALGPLDALRPRLPLVVELGGRRVRVVEERGELLAHDTVCPHLLGPLEEARVEEGALRCPWHGYRFDLRSGTCDRDPRLGLRAAPRVEIARDGFVRLVASDAEG